MNANLFGRGDSEGTIDHEIIALLFTLFDSFRSYFMAALESADLAMSQGNLLMCLEEPTPMHVLAKRVGFDASHITAIIDRLEERHLLERRSDPHDRRVKLITITTAGDAVKGQIRDRLRATLPPLSFLRDEEKVQIRDLLVAAVGPPRNPAALSEVP